MRAYMSDRSSALKRAVLLVNLGSPDSTETSDVKKYLREFLMDARVLDAPYLIRKFIVEVCILPFRPEKSAHAYRQIWWEEGSPLIEISRRLQTGLQKQLDWYRAQGTLTSKKSLDDMIDERFVKDALKKLGRVDVK